MEKVICGYTVHKLPPCLCSNTPLFSNQGETITVQIAKDALDYILGQIVRKNPIIASYKKARIVFESLKMVLENKTPKQISKEDIKTAIDVLKEIKNERANSESEKSHNAKMAFLCKLVIDGIYL